MTTEPPLESLVNFCAIAASAVFIRERDNTRWHAVCYGPDGLRLVAESLKRFGQGKTDAAALATITSLDGWRVEPCK